MAAQERQLSDRSIYAARPTVRVDGREQYRTTELLLAMTMVEQEGGLSSLELRLSNLTSRSNGTTNLAFEDESVLGLGSSLSIYAGDSVQPQEIFRGKVTSLEAEFGQDKPPEMVVFAEDALMSSRMKRRTLYRESVTIADLARDVAERAGMTPVITGLDADVGPQMQLNESDLAFLRRVLQAYDGDLQVVGDELHVSPRDEVRRGELALELYGQLTGARLTVDLAHQVSEITVAGWDPEQGAAVGYVSQGRALGPGSGRRGADVLTDALQARSEHMGHIAVVNDTEARLLADASYDQRARRFVVLEGSSEGNPAIRVGTHVAIRGLSARFDNTYYVNKVWHRFDLKRGYTTDFEAECAFLGEV